MASRFALPWLGDFLSAKSAENALTRQMAVITLAALAGAYAVAFFLGTRTPHLAQRYAGYSILGLLFVGAVPVLIYTLALLVRGEERPLAKVKERFALYLAPSALANRVLPIIMVFGFLGAFSIFKSLIPRLHPFAWDSAFSDFDRLIFGTDPWRITHAYIGPHATAWLDYAYVMWVPVFTCVVFWHSVFAPIEQKRRFFLSFYGCWIILGILSAIIFSSAGPCFLQLIGHPYADRYPFFPLENGHNSQRIMNYLASGFVTGDFGTAKGISAMPSMHIAVVTLYLVAARRPWTVLLSAAYFLAIFIGSIDLGWHYAVDGIFAAIGTVLIYSLTAARTRDRTALVMADAPVPT
jgi:hypothetical protein